MLGIALIAMGEEIGAEMALRTFGHLVSIAWKRWEYIGFDAGFPRGDFPDGFSWLRNVFYCALSTKFWLKPLLLISLFL